MRAASACRVPGAAAANWPDGLKLLGPGRRSCSGLPSDGVEAARTMSVMSAHQLKVPAGRHNPTLCDEPERNQPAQAARPEELQTVRWCQLSRRRDRNTARFPAARTPASRPPTAPIIHIASQHTSPALDFHTTESITHAAVACCPFPCRRCSRR